MAVRAADRVTLAVLPAPSYVRTYYLMQESTLSAPAKPNTNPPAAPWTTTEPAYTAGSTLTLYTAMVTVYGSVSFDWGDVQKSSSYEAAKQAYNLAAANATTIDGMRRLIASVAEPTAPAGGWMNGDQWWEYEVEPVTGRNRLSSIWVWNGTEFVPFQIVADSLLIPGSVGNILLADGAIDAMTITGAQIYGGYIEAPVIASSDKLGTGANVLNDPGLTSAVDTAWIASGHLGDTASRSQVDTISWDKTWTDQVWDQSLNSGYGGARTRTRRNWASVAVTATVSPGSARETGTVLFPNLSWFGTGARTISNPYAFENKVLGQMLPAQGGGASDPSWLASGLAAPAPVAGTARTTYLTNSATPSVAAGERWNARAQFTRIPEAFMPYVSAWVEVVNASTSAVLWSHAITTEELTLGSINAWWDVNFTGAVKFRVKFTYTAGGSALFIRRPASGGYARQSTDGVQDAGSWERSATSAIQYRGAPTTVAAGSYLPIPNSHLTQQVALTSALFAKVEPEKGWRLTEGAGLELFNALGAKTGQLDGEDNFISGTLATAEDGQRWELVGDQINLYSATNVLLGSIRRDGTTIRVDGALSLNGYAIPTEEIINLASTANLTLASGTSLHESSWLRKRSDGYVYGTLAFYRAAGFTSGATFATLGVGLRPNGGDQLPGVMWGAGSPGRCHFQMGGSANGVLIVWSPPANTQYVSAKVAFMAA